MKLKCIGGKLDGQEHEIENSYRKHDLVKINLLNNEFKVDTFKEGLKAYRENKTPDSMINKFEMYKVSVIYGTSINGEKLELKYLCPAHWHEWEAIKHQFAK